MYLPGLRLFCYSWRRCTDVNLVALASTFDHQETKATLCCLIRYTMYRKKPYVKYGPYQKGRCILKIIVTKRKIVKISLNLTMMNVNTRGSLLNLIRDNYSRMSKI